MNLKKCPSCNKYTLKEKCPICDEETKPASYKFIKIKNAPPRSIPFKK